MIDFASIQETIDRLGKEGLRAEVVLLPPDSFNSLVEKLFQQSGIRVTGTRFNFGNRLILSHRFLPPGQGYIIDREEAKRLLGYDPFQEKKPCPNLPQK